MKKYISKKQIVVLIFLALSIITLITVSIVSLFPSACETWTRTISRFYVTLVGSLSNLFSISFTEIFVIFGVILLVVLLIKSINAFRHKNTKKGLLFLTSILTIVSCTISTYSLACGPAYNREGLPVKLYEEKVENQKFEPVIAYFLNDYNEISKELDYYENGSVKLPYSHDELSYMILSEYAKIDDNYYHKFSSRIKPMMSSFLYLEFHITGFTCNLFGEANVNVEINESDIPFTMAHEMSHSKGVMREDDANLMATYLLLNSDNPYFRFSAYRRTFSNLLGLTAFLKDGDKTRNEFYNALSSKIKGDIYYTNRLYSEHDLLNALATWWNDLYLKIFGQNDGVDSYEDNMSSEDSGKKDDEGNIIYNPIFSRTQKLYFEIYFNK